MIDCPEEHAAAAPARHRWGPLFHRAAHGHRVRVPDARLARVAWHGCHKHRWPHLKPDLCRRPGGHVVLRLVPLDAPQSRWARQLGALAPGQSVRVVQKPHATLVAVARYRETHPDFHAELTPHGAGTLITRRRRPAVRPPSLQQRLEAMKEGASFLAPLAEASNWRSIVSRTNKANPGERWTLVTRGVVCRSGPGLRVRRETTTKDHGPQRKGESRDRLQPQAK